ncbi:DNA methyltransferase, partial [Nocardia zapadnayensis]|nr:DNA methyltransferase [Nocardia zapadnayensis]
MGGAAAQALRGQFGLRGRIDLTHPFVAALPRLMAPGGVLGLLCANRFLTTKAGANLRALLLADLTPVELYDLGDTKLFEAAVLPAVTIAVRGAARGECRYVSVYEEEAGNAPDPEPADPAAGKPARGPDSNPGTAHEERELFAALSGTTDAMVWRQGRRFAVSVGELATETGAAAASV